MPKQTSLIEAQRLVSGFRGYQRLVFACRLQLPDLVSDGSKTADENGGHPDEALSTVMSDLNMMIVLGGSEQTTDEYRNLLADAGLRMRRVIPTGSEFAAVEAVVAKR